MEYDKDDRAMTTSHLTVIELLAQAYSRVDWSGVIEPPENATVLLPLVEYAAKKWFDGDDEEVFWRIDQYAARNGLDVGQNI